MNQSVDGGVDLPLFYRLSVYETVGSTNVEARELADAGAEEGCIVWAKRQDKESVAGGETGSARKAIFIVP